MTDVLLYAAAVIGGALDLSLMAAYSRRRTKQLGGTR